MQRDRTGRRIPMVKNLGRCVASALVIGAASLVTLAADTATARFAPELSPAAPIRPGSMSSRSASAATPHSAA
jgi:hypothetical protein